MASIALITTFLGVASAAKHGGPIVEALMRPSGIPFGGPLLNGACPPCYTHHVIVDPDTPCPKSTEACLSIPDEMCSMLSAPRTKTIPGPNPACTSTPTVTVTAHCPAMTPCCMSIRPAVTTTTGPAISCDPSLEAPWDFNRTDYGGPDCTGHAHGTGYHHHPTGHAHGTGHSHGSTVTYRPGSGGNATVITTWRPSMPTPTQTEGSESEFTSFASPTLSLGDSSGGLVFPTSIDTSVVEISTSISLGGGDGSDDNAPTPTPTDF